MNCFDSQIPRNKSLFKLVATRSAETCLLRGLRYANVSLTHSLRCRHCSELVGPNESAFGECSLYFSALQKSQDFLEVF